MTTKGVPRCSQGWVKLINSHEKHWYGTTLTQIQREASGDGVCESFAGKEGISGDPLAGTLFSPGCGREAWGAHGRIWAGCRAGGGLEDGIIGPFVTPHTVTSLVRCPFPAHRHAAWCPAFPPPLARWPRAIILCQTHLARGNKGQQQNRNGVYLSGIALKTFRLQTLSPRKCNYCSRR